MIALCWQEYTLGICRVLDEIFADAGDEETPDGKNLPDISFGFVVALPVDLQNHVDRTSIFSSSEERRH